MTKLGDHITGGDSDISKPLDDLRQARQNLQNIRTENEGIQRRAEEGIKRMMVLQANREQAANLESDAKHLEPRAAKLTANADKFKGALIYIKAKSTVLRNEASGVEAGAATTQSDSKSDFAFGILNIVEEAIFDFVVKDEVENIMGTILTLWTTDGVNKMPPRLKKRYDEVKAKVDQLQQGPADDEWNKAVEDTQER